jgi:MFS family permease
VGPAVAFIIGPLAGGLIADVISQQAVFVTCAVVFSLALLLATRLTEPPLHNRGNRRGGYIDIVRHRPMRLVVVYGFAIVLVLSFGATFLPNLITDKYGFSDQQRGIAFSFGAVGTLFLSTAMAKTDRINHIRGVAIGVVSVGAMCLVALLISNVYVLSPAFILRGGITPKHLQERSFASIEFATGVGNTIAPVLAGVAYELDQSLPFVIGAFLLPILGAVAIWLERNVVRPAVEARRRADRRESAALEPAPSPGPA